MNELTTQPDAAIAERVMVMGDLAQLSASERVQYYGAVCRSLGLNPLTKPFDYITLNGKLTLYARKDAADQLRKINGVSITRCDVAFQDDLIVVTVGATDKSGRSDIDVGVVGKKDMSGNIANATMKAITKGKRRVTLSICGLGMLDETEVEAIPDARPVRVKDDGAIETPVIDAPARPVAAVKPPTAWKDELAKLGNEAKVLQLVASEHGDSVMASRLLTAIETGRALFAKNGAASQVEIDTTLGNLRALIAEAKQAEAQTA